MFYKQRRIGICRNRYLEYTGTPISNSMTELYTLMRYLQAGLLKDVGIQHFDEWAADFGEVVTDFEYILLCSENKREYIGLCRGITPAHALFFCPR